MRQRFLASLETISQCAQPDRFLLGVSGGCDSVALLHMLHSLNDAPPIKVVHFDHQQRGRDSDMDREFVVDLCEGLGISVQCFLWSDAATSLSTRTFSQATARDWRRSTMEEIAGDEIGNTVVLTAHHKDDAEETQLLKLLRGVHLTNISGLPMMKKSDESGIIWGRPLIDIRKCELEAFLRSEGLSWREDATNKSSKYLRNRVRNELIPLLKDMMDEDCLERRLQNLEDQAKELRDDLDERIGDISTDTEYLPLPMNVRMDVVYRHALHQWANRQGCTISYEQSRRIEDQLHNFPDRTRWRLNIGQSWDVQRVGSVLRLIDTKMDTIDIDQDNQKLPHTSLSTSRGNVSPAHTNSSEAVELHVEAEAIHDNLAFYQTTFGDFQGQATFTPPWKEKPMKMKDFLRGKKVPLHMRNSVKIIVSGDRIAAVGICDSNASRNEWVVDASFSPSQSSTKVNVYPI